jgi:hypothetical protein
MMNRRLRERLTEADILQIFVDVCERVAAEVRRRSRCRNDLEGYQPNTGGATYSMRGQRETDGEHGSHFAVGVDVG